MKFYIPPATNVCQMTVFAERLDEILGVRDRPIPLMAVQEGLARAGGYADAHAATCHANGTQDARIPLLPGVSSRRLKEWAKPLQQALNQGYGSPKESLACSWGHASHTALLVALDTESQALPDHGFLRQIEGRGPWFGRSSQLLPSAPKPFLVFGRDQKGDRWGMDERQACRHTHLIGPADTTRHQWVQQALTQRHSQNSPTVWVGEELGTFDVASRAPRLGARVDWAASGSPDINVRGLSLKALVSLQIEVIRHLYEHTATSLYGDFTNKFVETAEAFSQMILAQPASQKVGLRDVAQFWISDTLENPHSGQPCFSGKQVKTIWEAAAHMEETLSCYADWWADFRDWFDPDLPMVDMPAREYSQAWRLPEAKMRWGRVAKESLIPSLVCNVAIQLLHGNVTQQLSLAVDAEGSNVKPDPSSTTLWVIESDHVWSHRQHALAAQLRSLSAALIWVQTSNGVIHPAFHDEREEALRVVANLATRLAMGPQEPRDAKKTGILEGWGQLQGASEQLILLLKITNL